MLSKIFQFVLLVLYTSSIDIMGVDGLSFTDFDFGSKKTLFLYLLTYEKCPDEGNGDLHFVGRQSRINRTLVIENANMTFRVPFDDNMKVKLAIDIWGNGGWRPNGFVMEWANGCSEVVTVLGEGGRALFSHMTLVRHLTNATTTAPINESNPIHPQFKCPVPAGLYHERNMDVSLYNRINIPRFIKGRWRMNIHFIRKRDNQVLGCFRRLIQVDYKNKIGT